MKSRFFMPLLAIGISLFTLQCTSEPETADEAPGETPVSEVEEPQKEMEYTFEIVDSLRWGTEGVHTIYTINTNKANKEAIIAYSEGLPINRSVRAYFFESNAISLPDDRDQAFADVQAAAPAATTYRLAIGEGMTTYSEGYSD
jgi:hypothetical protein